MIWMFIVLLWKLLFQTSLCERSVCFVVIFFSFDLCPRLGLVLGDINVYFVAIPTFSSKHSLWEVCFFVVILFAFPSAFIPSLRRLHECLFCCYAKFYFKRSVFFCYFMPMFLHFRSQARIKEQRWDHEDIII